MTHFSKCHNFLLILLSVVTLNVTGQEAEKLWKTSNLTNAVVSKQIDYTNLPKSYQVYELDEVGLRRNLIEKAAVIGKNSTTKNIVAFPNANGEMEAFEVEEKSIFAPELQVKYPDIKSYIGRSLENPERQVRFSSSSYGVNAVIFDREQGSFYIDKINSTKAYLAYHKKNANMHKMTCLVEDQVTSSVKNQVYARNNNADDGFLRTFRLAVATTGEYSQYHLTDRGINAGATDAVKKAAVLDAINVAMTRVNGIFERDVALTMVLVANNDEIIFLDPNTDGFSNNDTSALIEESQSTINSVIQSANYDIGHTFSTGAGGLAALASPCDFSNKARAVTGISNPKGDAFYVDFVAHEMGHQYGANHTFNGTAGNCAGNENMASAVEPGSGTTIMGYAGICSPENVQSRGDDYFHLVSIREMWLNITSGASTCAQTTTPGNSAPVLDPLENHTIPISTPFALSANATDADGDNMTYTWEQLDNETATIPLVSTHTGGPAFRSLPPTNSNVRYFPSLQTTLNGQTSSTWEVLPSVARSMRFGVNVRDNNLLVGQTASEETILTVTDQAGPFVVTSQSTNVVWDAGTSQTVTWDVAGTNADPVNCDFVNILLSLDGGATFSQTLASNVANDGSHNVVVPGITTSDARIMVQSVGNVFFALNSTDFSIQSSEFIMDFASTSQEVCAPAEVTYNFNFETFLGFNENTTFSASGNPAGTTVVFNPTSATANNTAVQMTIQGITEAHVGSYEITVTGTATSVTKNTLVNLNVFSSNITAPTLVAPADGAANINKPYTLSWNPEVNALSYSLEVASDAGFSTIVDSATLTSTQYDPQNLIANTTYYWRVMAENNCGQSSYSSVFSFSTENEVCNQYTSADTPITIPDNFPVGVEATIDITDDLNILDVNVGVTVSHTWVGDIRLVLFDPNGNSVILVSNSGNSGAAYTNTIFDSEADLAIGSASPPFTGSFRPEGDLTVFNGESSNGIWRLNVSDNESQDLGNLVSFELFICGVPVEKDSNDFTVLATGETCPDEDNGMIEITSHTVQDYTADFNGQTYAFTSDLVIDNIAPGTYDLCVTTVADGTEQCYSLTIEEGVILSAKSTLKSKSIEIEVEEGTAPYKVFKNDIFLFESSNSTIEVDVAHGDMISVASKVACEGVYSKAVNLLDYVSLYPNPVKEVFNISIPSDKREVQVDVYATTGQLIQSKVKTVQNHKVVLDSGALAQGVYFVRIGLQEPVILKMVKE